jgi:hypothetical protein
LLDEEDITHTPAHKRNFSMGSSPWLCSRICRRVRMSAIACGLEIQTIPLLSPQTRWILHSRL